ncbi:MAG: hypothetical protein FJ215_00455 [Ignavibacteria bacterium]|nr:hypothetical protein [Ignavibacteria bacterium]
MKKPYCSRVWIGLACMLATTWGGRAQESALRSLTTPTDGTRFSMLQFDRTLNTFLWLGKLYLDRNFGSTSIRLSQESRSRIVKTDPTSIKDDLTLSVNVVSDLKAGWSLHGAGRSLILSDNRTVELSSLSQHQIYAGPEYRPGPRLRASFLGGYEFASQEGVRDRGFSYIAEIVGDQLMVEEFDADMHFRSIASYLDRRSPRADSLSLMLRRQFGDLAWNKLTVRSMNQRREFYTLADTAISREHRTDRNIFRREARDLSITDTLVYAVDRSLRLTVRGGLLSRGIRRSYEYKSAVQPSAVPLDVSISEFSVHGSLSLEKEFGDWLMSALSLSYDEREEKHAVRDDPSLPRGDYERQEKSARRLGNIASRTGVSANAVADVTASDRLRFGGSASVLRYDTPDTLNTDDRDELLVSAGLGWLHVVGSHLSIDLFADVSLNHLVYLSRLQSANNNWNRIVRLRAEVRYAPSSWIRNVTVSEVLANYTVYDFEEQIRSVRSFSFRQAYWSDSLGIRLNRRMDFSVTGNLRLYERGILRWKEFKERPENYIVEVAYWPQISYIAGPGIRIAVGYRVFFQDRYRVEGGVSVFERRLHNGGPTVALIWDNGSNQHFILHGWRETQSEDNVTLRRTSNLTMTVGILI